MKEIIFSHFWIVILIASLLNGIRLNYLFKGYVLQNPRLEKGYQKILLYTLLYGNIPWIIMATGDITGVTTGSLEYLKPASLNPMVFLFYASILILLFFTTRWIYSKGGAEFLEDHPGFNNAGSMGEGINLTAKQIKSIFPIIILCCMVSIVFLWLKDFRVFKI
jgi:hypothetical protein